MPDLRLLAAAIHAAALHEVDARRRVAQALAADPPPGEQPLVVLGAGKAAAAMAAGAEDALGSRIVGGVVVTKDGHGLPLHRITVLEAGHPEPDARSVAAGQRLLAEARATGPGDLILGLWSGGGSALIEVPAPGVTLAQITAEVAALAAEGASIDVINAHRRTRSAIKGGRLADATRARWHHLVVSDVAGDDPALVASGPAIHRGDPARIVATLADAIEGARREAEARGWLVVAAPGLACGDAADLGRALADAVNHLHVDRPTCLLGAGEPIVRLGADPGRGGRMQEAALAAALALRHPTARLWFAGTDGTDGPTDAAGATVDASTAARIRATGLDPALHRSRHDAYPALDAAGALIRTGPTRTNVGDLWFALVPGPAPR